MKKINKFFSISGTFKDGFISDAMVTLGNSFEFPALFRKLGFRILSACSHDKVKFTSRLRQLTMFHRYILAMNKHHGGMYTVKYLKACQLAIQKRIAKDRITSLRDLEPDLPLPRLTTSALPRFIPLRDRRLICSGSTFVIRWWLSLFSVYRVISIPGKLKLNTITDAFSGNSESSVEIAEHIRKLVEVYSLSWPKFRKNSEPRVLLLETSSPNMVVSWLGQIIEPGVMPPQIYNNLMEYCRLAGYEYLERYLEACRFITDSVSPFWRQKIESLRASVEEKGFFKATATGFGQLSPKSEAAGKIRIFAMVDIWTQSILKPLHMFLFDILRGLPTDGTFDQEESVNRCFLKAKATGCSYGYDLSAATDRLPLFLQLRVLAPLIGNELADVWGRVLVDRDYILNENKKLDIAPATLRYSVGQPMGAYSSWAMLALTHHMIVQYAHKLAYPGRGPAWFMMYELLGDDINIFDALVAEKYLFLMDQLGLTINVSKSVVAKNNSFEFAKVTGHMGHNVSAVSWKSFISQNTMMGRINIVYSLINRIKPRHFLVWFKRITRKSKYTVGDWNYSVLALFSMLATKGNVPIQEMYKSLYDLEKPTLKFYRAILLNSRINYIIGLIGGILKKSSLNFASSPKVEAIWNVEEVWIKLSVWRPIQMFIHKYRGNTLLEEQIANSIFHALFPWFAPGAEFFEFGKGLKTTVWNDQWSPDQQYFNAIYLALYMGARDRAIEFIDEICHDGVTMDIPLSDLVSVSEKIERCNELLEVADRAKTKVLARALGLSSKPKVGSKVVQSPLALVKKMVDANKRRPDWTKGLHMYNPLPKGRR